ncbi:AKT2 kinase, partial [Loxia curvirostra]|nr:AKT2 kinase [Loxia curvirostra]
MKILRKDNIATKSQLEHTQIERNVLKNVVHPFIVKLYYAFQTSTKLYFILEYCPGGELFFHLSKFKEFSEEIVKFYAALKPENILLDEQGHIRLTDFGLSKDGIKDNFSATSLCGTPEYLAPEIISQTGHGKAVDWWSLGIMIFEMLTGSLPFNSSNRKVLFDRITYTELHYPKKISPIAADLLKKLFEKNPR